MKLSVIFEDLMSEQPLPPDPNKMNYGVPNRIIVPNNISKNGLELIKSSEGFKDKPYVDSKNKIVVGYGTTIPNASFKNKKITEKEGENLLLNHINKYVVPVIKKYVKVPLTQNEFDALSSLIYNIGDGAFIKSKLLSDGINKRDRKAILKHWDWLKAYGKETPVMGLVKRREKEKSLFFGKWSA
jgi:lysozyme